MAASHNVLIVSFFVSPFACWTMGRHGSVGFNGWLLLIIFVCWHSLFPFYVFSFCSLRASLLRSNWHTINYTYSHDKTWHAFCHSHSVLKPFALFSTPPTPTHHPVLSPGSHWPAFYHRIFVYVFLEFDHKLKQLPSLPESLCLSLHCGQSLSP